MNDELCRLCGVQCNMTSAYHLQSNGLDERFNQTLQRQVQLLKFVESEQNSWDQYLDAIYSFHIEYCARTQPSIHPFFLCMVITLDCQLSSLCSALVPVGVTSLMMDYSKQFSSAT